MDVVGEGVIGFQLDDRWKSIRKSIQTVTFNKTCGVANIKVGDGRETKWFENVTHPKPFEGQLDEGWSLDVGEREWGVIRKWVEFLVVLDGFGADCQGRQLGERDFATTEGGIGCRTWAFESQLDMLEVFTSA